MVVLSDCVTRNQKLRNNESSPPPPQKKGVGGHWFFQKWPPASGDNFLFWLRTEIERERPRISIKRNCCPAVLVIENLAANDPGWWGGTAEKQRTPPVHQKKQMKKRNVGVWVSIYFLFQLKTFDHFAQWNSLNFRFFFFKLLGD